MNCDYCTGLKDHGGNPYVLNMGQSAMRNSNFRTAAWTGIHLQMTLMCIPPCGEVGLEIHTDTDQFIRVEQGNAVVKMGKCKNQLTFRQNLRCGDAVFVPAGTWHNIVNAGRNSLKLSSIYAPPHHPKGTIHHTKKEAEREESGYGL